MTGARNPQPRLHAWERLAGAACLFLCMAAGVSAGLGDRSALPYARLDTPGAGGGTASDNRTFAGTDACAWLEVTGTSISYPVMALQPEMPDDFYLTHDAWGTPAIAGCPYLDRRTEPEARHLLVYAHSGLASGLMFGPLRLAYLPERFSTLGNAVWIDRSGAITVFRPLCALEVASDYPEIQRFDCSAKEIAEVAFDIAKRARARTVNWDDQAASCTRLLTLVTCSKNAPRSAGRTLVLFTA